VVPTTVYTVSGSVDINRYCCDSHQKIVEKGFACFLQTQALNSRDKNKWGLTSSDVVPQNQWEEWCWYEHGVLDADTPMVSYGPN